MVRYKPEIFSRPY